MRRVEITWEPIPEIDTLGKVFLVLFPLALIAGCVIGIVTS
jgi:hypothetical protein